MADLNLQVTKNYRLVTAKILYHMPDYHELLQEFIWQNYDIAPKFPELNKFLHFWERKIEGKLHSVFVANTEVITTSDYRTADWEGTMQ